MADVVVLCSSKVREVRNLQIVLEDGSAINFEEEFFALSIRPGDTIRVTKNGDGLLIHFGHGGINSFKVEEKNLVLSQ